MKMMLLAHLLLFLCCTMTVSAQDCGFGLAPCENSGDCIGGICSCTQGYAGDLCGSEILFDVTPNGIYQEGDTITVQVTKIGGDYDLVLTATYTGTATENSDYGSVFGSYTIDSSSSSLDGTINVMDDDESEAGETIILTLTAQNGPTISRTYTIAANDPVKMVPSGSSFTEGDGLVSITFTCHFPSGTSSSTFNAAVTDGTATSSDYSFVPSASYGCTFGAPTFTVDITITDDNTPETDETFRLTLTSSLPFSGLTSGNLDVAIADDDSLAVSPSFGSVSEGGPPLGFTSTTFSFPNGEAVPIPLTLTVAGGTAILNTDFTASESSGVISFTYDESDPSSRASLDALTISFPEDSIVEGDETFTIAFTSDYLLTGTTSETVTITDNDVEVLTITSPTVDEDAGSVTITISRTATIDSLVVTVATRVPTTGGYPITTDDITMQSNVQLTFSGLTVTFTVAVLNDEIAEPDETFEVTVTAPGSIADVVGTVTITNDDADVVTLPTFLAAYENAGSKFITITRTVDDKEVTVQVNTNDGTAKAGTDYTGLTNHDVTFGVGSLTATFSVDITQDSDDEDDETFTLTVSGSTVKTSATYTFLIVDDEGSRPFDCRRMNQDCAESTDVCNSDLPLCECTGGLGREGDMCNIVTAQKDGAACTGVTCNSNGVCLDDSGVTSCACFPGYYGDDCEHAFLKAVCFSENMILLANPHGNFGGKIYVKDKLDVSDCTAEVVPNPPAPDDNIDDALDGFYLDVRHDSTTCGVISPVEGASETSYSRQFFIQYDPDITTGVDQCVTVSCSFDRNSLIVNAGVVTIDPNGPYVPENAVNTFSPLTMEMDIDGTPVTDSTTVVLAKKLCVTLRIPQDFGGLEIIDIDFNNTLPSDPKSWRAYTAGCTEARARSVLIDKPFYSVSGSKRTKKFCFFAFKFVNSLKLTTQVKVKICVDPSDCNVGTCVSRRKRQTVSSRETTVGATFNIYDPSTATARIGQDQTGVNATIIRTEEVCNLPLEFLPTVICLGVLVLVLVLLCLYLTYRLVRKSTSKMDKPPVKSFH